MEYRISEVFPASAVNDAVLVPCFFEDNDALVLARGNQLVVYIIEGEFVTEPKSFELYGQIEKLIPIRYSRSAQSNLLVVLTDLHCCILQCANDDPNNLITKSSGTLQQTWDAPRVPIRYVLHPTCVILQLEKNQLEVYPITSNCTLDPPIRITKGAKRIIDFQFIGPTSKVTRLTVLIEEYNKPPTLHLFEIDLTNHSFTEDPTFDVSLPNSYFMVPYDLECHSIAVSFSFQQATRVYYNEIVPVIKTATIFTNEPLIKMTELAPELYIAIDEKLNLKTARIEEAGKVQFVKIGTTPVPSEIVAISPNLAFIGSRKDDSVFLSINQENNTYTSSVFDTIRSTGQIIRFKLIENSIVSIYERAIIRSTLMVDFFPLLNIEIPSKSCFDRMFAFFFEEKELSCYVLSNTKYSKLIGKSIDGEVTDISAMIDSTSPTIGFYELGDDAFLQVTNMKIIKYYKESQVAVFQSDNEQQYIQSIFSEGKLAITNSNNKIEFFDILSDCEEQIQKEKFAFTPIGKLAAIAFSKVYLAIATVDPFKVNVYQINNREIVNTYELGLIVDLKFRGNTLYALCPSDEVKIIQPEINIVNSLKCCGHHTFMRTVDDRTIMICGQSPAVIIDNEIYPLNSKEICDAAFCDNQAVLLTSDSLSLGSFAQPNYISNSYSSKHPIIDIINFEDFYVIVRQNNKGQIIFYSSDDFLGNDISRKKFGELDKNEKYVGSYVYQDNIFICSGNKVIRYRSLKDCNFVKSGSKKFTRQIFEVGSFRDFVYLQFCEEIHFFRVRIRDDKKCGLNDIFTITTKSRICCSTFGSHTAAIMYSKNIIGLYTFDDYNECFTPLPYPYQAFESITSLAITGDRVFFSTKNGNIFSLDLLEVDNTTQEYKIKDGCNVGQRVHKMTTLAGNNGNNNSNDKPILMVSTIDGAAMIVEPLRNLPNFDALYKTLAERLTSIGSFKKVVQRTPKIDRHLLPKQTMCDTDLLRAFAELGQLEQQELLVNTGISLRLAKDIIQHI